MGWNSIKSKISTPCMTSDGITQILKSCMLDDGQNKSHSASLKINGYEEPKHNMEKVDENEVKKIQFDLIRYMAHSLLENCDSMESNSYVSKFIHGWKEKNPKIDITIKDLKKIAEMTDNEIEKRLNRTNRITDIDRFIEVLKNKDNLYKEIL